MSFRSASSTIIAFATHTKSMLDDSLCKFAIHHVDNFSSNVFATDFLITNLLKSMVSNYLTLTFLAKKTRSKRFLNAS